MTAQSVAIAGRRAAESLMTSTCTITARSGEPVTDPDTGAVSFPAGPVVYSGKCRVKPSSTWGRTAEAGGEQVAPSTFTVSVPFAVTAVDRGHVVRIDASPDGWLVGRVLEVRFAPESGDHVTARRLLCEEPS
jgi:hypothetical protein